MEPVKLISTNETYVKHFKTYGTRITFKFNAAPEGVSDIDWLKKGFAQIVDSEKAKSSDTDYLGFTLKSLNLKHKEPGYTAITPASKINSDELWNIFGGIIQSNSDSITSSDTFQVHCTRVEIPKGKGRAREGKYNNFVDECNSRKGIVAIQNNDNLCLPRAIVVAKAHAKKDPQYKAIRQNKGNRQEIRAKKLMVKAGVDIPAEGGGVPELIKFQSHLKKYKITVYHYNTKGREVYFEGENPNAALKINLLFNNGHFNVITNLTGAFACHFFCEHCHMPYDHKGVHRCAYLCPACCTLSPPCKIEDQGMLCDICNITYKNPACFHAHLSGRCKAVKKCKECGRLVFLACRKSKHVCGEVYCKVCVDFKPPNHQCYMKIDKRHPPTKDFLFIFFDLETRQDETFQDDSDTHVHNVNLCISKQYCWQCIDGQHCANCESKTNIFKSDPISQFMEYVLEVRKQFRNVCIMAHNGQGFDFQFIFKYILENTKFEPEIISRGTKIILMELDNVRFIDSLSYFPMALSALPKSFDLPPEKMKGYFPHLFNTLANQTYVGPLPAKEYYCPDSMFKEGHKDFEKWHDKQVASNYIFDFQKEIVAYCLSDVEILAQACIKFRSLFIEKCKVDPFLEATTIASACNLAFRRNFLKSDTIGLIPEKGYRLVDNQSGVALQWLSWEEEKRQVRIQHAGREREVKIEGLKVDGFDGERIYEFQGCYYHGCPRCFPNNRDKPLKDDPSDSLAQRFERTELKLNKLKETTYEIVTMWECEFKQLKGDESLKYLENLPILNTLPLNPRDAFFGGRTGNTKTYHKCDEGETIRYVDVCSLYPWVCKYGKYPIGHPTIHVGDDECRHRIETADGLVKCKIVPPTDLYHPVLPVKMHDKLMFLLCQTCGEDQNPDNCEHDDKDKALVGTWTTDEIRKAIQKGYRVAEIYEMWEYKVATYENGGLFTEFINTFLKIKQEASGYPNWVETETDKYQYIRDYFANEGILLDKDKICTNEGLRSLAKLILNSFWGKLGQKTNQTKTMIVRKYDEYLKMITSPEVHLNFILPINEKVMILNWRYLEEVGDPSRTTNVVLAAYTTAQARLKLYEHLEALDRQVNYYDTDSCIYTYRKGQYEVPTGDYLGQMTDELIKPYGQGSYIMEFVSGGPKTYAYKVFSTKKGKTKTVCKVKGLTLNHKTSELMNFETLKQMILDETKSTLKIEQDRIRRTKHKDIITMRETKVFKITGPKRKYDGEYDTLPYGYKKQRV